MRFTGLCGDSLLGRTDVGNVFLERQPSPHLLSELLFGQEAVAATFDGDESLAYHFTDLFRECGAGDAEVMRQLRGVVLGREPSVGAGRAIQQVGDEAVADGPLREDA